MRDRVSPMRLGVDFGTTTTAIAIVDRGNYPIVSFVNNREDTVDFIPSILALDGDHLVYGFDAEDAAREGAPHLRSFKRLLSDHRLPTHPHCAWAATASPCSTRSPAS